MKKNNLVLLAYLAVCFFWGSTYLAIKYGVMYFPPLTFAGIRFIVAGLLMVAYGRIKGMAFPKNLKSYIPIALVGTFMLAGGNGFVTLAETKVASGIASLFIAMVPIYIAVIELFTSKTKLSTSGYLGLLLGFVGVYILIRPSEAGQLITIEGTIMLLLAGLLWSVGSVYSKFVDKSIGIIPSIGLQMLSGGLVLFILGRFVNESLPQTLNMTTLYALLYLIVFGSIVGYSSYIYVLSKWPAAKAGTYAYINPIVALFLGFMMLREPLNLEMFVSMTIILFSVFLVQKAKVTS